MDDVTDLKEIERRAFLVYHKDGILDVYLGFSIITLSFLFLIEGGMIGAFSGILALFPILYRESKKNYTFPRLGYVKFSERKGRSRNSFLTLFGLLALSFVGGLWAFHLGNVGNYLWIDTVRANLFWFLALLSLGLFTLFGCITDLRRLHYYGLISFVLFASGNYVPIDGFWPTLILGGVVMVTGLILLQRFVHEYPLNRSAEDG